MPISKDEVRYIANLARLELSESEVEKFSIQLSKILDHAAVIKQLDVEEMRPLTHAVDQRNVFRVDEVECGLKIEDALSNAPSKENGAFKIPPIL